MTKSSVSQDESLLLPPEPREPCRKPAPSAGDVSVFWSCCCISPRDWGSQGRSLRLSPHGPGQTRAAGADMGLSTPSSPSAPAWSTASWAPQGQSLDAATQLPEFLGRLPLHLHQSCRGLKGPLCIQDRRHPTPAFAVAESHPLHHRPWYPRSVCVPSAGPPQPMPRCRGHVRGCTPGRRTTPPPCPCVHRPARTDPHLAGLPLGHEGWPGEGGGYERFSQLVMF